MKRAALLRMSGAILFAAACAQGVPYAVVDTGQDRCYDNDREIAYPAADDAFDGQDAQYVGREPSYRDNGDGTVSDLNTGLMWQKTPDLYQRATFGKALEGAKTLRLAGYADWRLPTIKELYSLIDFRGNVARQERLATPYLDARTFAFVWGDPARGERLADAQYWSSTEYVGRAMLGAPIAFGVNFADGRIKGYPKVSPRGDVRLFVRYVRGNPLYGINDFVDNGDGTVSDRATGLMWQRDDSARCVDWRTALAYARHLDLAGHSDWRLPNAKELQSLVDYTRAPDAPFDSQQGPAISPVFSVTTPEAWYWTGTTHVQNFTCNFAVYLCFGQAMGTMNGVKMNVHGAGALRSDPKAGDRSHWQGGNGPQGDEVRILNYVRCVRGGGVMRRIKGPPLKDFSGECRAGRRSGFVGRWGADGDGCLCGKEQAQEGPSMAGPPFRARSVVDALFENARR